MRMPSNVPSSIRCDSSNTNVSCCGATWRTTPLLRTSPELGWMEISCGPTASNLRSSNDSGRNVRDGRREASFRRKATVRQTLKRKHSWKFHATSVPFAPVFKPCRTTRLGLNTQVLGIDGENVFKGCLFQGLSMNVDRMSGMKRRVIDGLRREAVACGSWQVSRPDSRGGADCNCCTNTT